MKLEVSFIIPAFNEEAYIEKCLNSINDGCDNVEIIFETIVINTGSTDNTRTIAEGIASEVITTQKSNPAKARNSGIAIAKYNILAFIDGDIELEEQWFIALSKLASETHEDSLFVTGDTCKTPKDGTWIEKYWFANLKSNSIGSANMITSRASIEAAGPFDESLDSGEDFELCRRIVNAGGWLKKDSGFCAIHWGFPKSLKQFIRREIWHGYGDFRSLQDFKDSRVAQLGIVYLMVFVGAFMFLATSNSILWPILMLATLLIVNLVITFKRFPKPTLQMLWFNSFLNLCYFIGRGLSIFKLFRT